jgi:MFS family permease
MAVCLYWCTLGIVSIFLFLSLIYQIALVAVFGAWSNFYIYRNLISSLVAGQVSDKIGRRYTIVIALIISFAAVTLEVVATTNELFFGGKFLNGFATGTLASVCVTYIGEVGTLLVIHWSQKRTEIV